MNPARQNQLDNWQMAFAALILSFAFVASNLPALTGIGSFGRIIFAGALLALTLRQPRHRRERPWADRILLALWGCVAVSVASTIWSVKPAETLAYGVVFAFLVGTFQGVVRRRWVESKNVYSDLRVAYYALSTVVVVGAISAFAGLEFAIGFAERARGLFENANKLGSVAAFSAVLGIALSQATRIRFLSIVLPLLIWALFASGSRTALIALLLGGGWLFVRLGFVARFWAIWSTLLVSTTWLLLHSFRVVESIDLATGPLARFFQEDDSAPLSGRVDVWQFSANAALETRIGVGFGASGSYLAEQGQPGSVFNSYLQWFLETGYAGVIPVTALLFLSVGVGLTRFLPRSATGLVAVVIAGLAMQVTESMMFGLGQFYPLVFWLIVLALGSVRDIGREHYGEEGSSNCEAQQHLRNEYSFNARWRLQAGQ